MEILDLTDANIWVTGSNGFLGSQLSEYLVRKNARVCGISRMVEKSNQPNKTAAYTMNADISKDSLNALHKIQGSPDLVFHLAGGASVGRSVADPSKDFVDSVFATEALLSWLGTHTTAKVVFSSSAAVYGQGSQNTISETQILAPVSPYGWHKKITEDLLHKHSQISDIQNVIIRIFSVFGPGLMKQLFWDIHQRLKKGTTSLEFSGTGKEIRDWIYISDLIEVIVQLALDPNATGETINVGTGNGTTVETAINSFLKAMNNSSTYAFSGQPIKGDPFSLVADISKMQSFYSPTFTDFAEAIKETAIWYANQEGTR